MRPSILPTLALIIMVMGAGAFAAWFVMNQDEPAPPPAIALDTVEPLNTPEREGTLDSPGPADTVIQPAQPEDETAAKSAPGITPAEGPAQPDASLKKAPSPVPNADTEKRREELKKAQTELDRIRELVETRLEVAEPEGPKVPFQATIRGIVVDGSNNPVVGASVLGTSFEVPGAAAGLWVSRVAIANAASGPVIATTDGAGEFTARIDKQTREGAKVSLRISAKAAGFATSPSQDVVVGNGDEKSGIRLVLPGAGSVTGRVVDAHGAGVSGARVTLSQGGGSGSFEVHRVNGIYGVGGSGAHTAVSDTAGNFTIADLAEGRYRAAVSASGWRQTSGPTEVTVKTGESTILSADFVMKAAAQIKISLRDSDGNPLTKLVMLSLKSETSGSHVRRLAAQDGVYTWNDAPAGTFMATVLVSGYVSVSAQCVVTDGLLTDLGSFTLEKTAPTSPALPPSGG